MVHITNMHIPLLFFFWKIVFAFIHAFRYIQKIDRNFSNKFRFTLPEHYIVCVVSNRKKCDDILPFYYSVVLLLLIHKIQWLVVRKCLFNRIHVNEFKKKKQKNGPAAVILNDQYGWKIHYFFTIWFCLLDRRINGIMVLNVRLCISQWFDENWSNECIISKAFNLCTLSHIGLRLLLLMPIMPLIILFICHRLMPYLNIQYVESTA